MLEPTSGINPCQVGRVRRYQSRLQLVAGNPIVSPAIPQLGASGDHAHLSAAADQSCSGMPVGLYDDPNTGETRIARCVVDQTWWVLTAHCLEVVRENPVPANPLPPLSQQDILRLGRAHAVTLKGRAVLADSTTRQTVRDFDLNHGSTFTWRGGNVELRVLTDPDPSIAGPVDNRPEGIAGAVIVDSLVGYSASPIVWGGHPSQQDALQFTQIVSTTPGIRQLVPIPEGARRLTWSQLAGAAITPTWVQSFGTGPTVVPLTVINGGGVLIPQDVPGMATDVAFIGPAVAPTQIIFRWELIV